MPKEATPPLLTRSLVIVAVNVVVLSLIFSIYNVHISLSESLDWGLRQAYEFERVRWLVDSSRSYVGLGKLLPKVAPRVASSTTSGSRKHSAPKTLPNLENDGGMVFNNEQLALFDGTRESKSVYLAVLGRVYDVERGRHHYGPRGGYHGFAGKDASRAFVTGDFSSAGLVDDVDGFGEQEMLSISDWQAFYERDYKFVGVVEGRYYDARGKPTAYNLEVRERLAAALEYQKERVRESEAFPACNSEYSKDRGGRVWCTTKSGGVEREWMGVPRRLYAPGSKTYRCACVKNFGAPLTSTSAGTNTGDLNNPHVREYPNCSPTSNSCKLSKSTNNS